MTRLWSRSHVKHAAMLIASMTLVIAVPLSAFRFANADDALPDCNKKVEQDTGLCGTPTPCNPIFAEPGKPCGGTSVEPGLHDYTCTTDNGSANTYCGPYPDSVCTQTRVCKLDEGDVNEGCIVGAFANGPDGKPIVSTKAMGRTQSCKEKPPVKPIDPQP